MKAKEFGNTGLTVTPLGLGLAALGRPGYITLGHADDLKQSYELAAMEAQTHAVLDAAWAAGIRYFDAARSYGRAEAFLASWLQQRQIDPAAVTIGSKWGYRYTADWAVSLAGDRPHEVKEHTLPILQRQMQESRALLGDHLDLYQIHSATLESRVLHNEPVLAELARLRDGGLAIGFSVSGPQQPDSIRRALEIEFDGRLLFSAVQATWNLLEQSAADALRDAHEAGLGVIIKEALANGRLTARNEDPEFAAQRALLDAQAQKGQTSIDAVALAATIHEPFADIVLSGAARVAHLESNLQALQVAWDESLAEIADEVRESPDRYWRIRGQLAWN